MGGYLRMVFRKLGCRKVRESEEKEMSRITKMLSITCMRNWIDENTSNE